MSAAFLLSLLPASLGAQPIALGLRPAAPQLAAQNATAISEAGSAGPQVASAVATAPPDMLILPAGTIITVEPAQLLSSDTQHEGDSFVAELQNPLVVDGWVVARPGQTVLGRVAKAKQAGRIKGTAKLSLELQQIVLVNGLQAPVASELVENSGPASHGRDVAAVAISSGVGAAIGALCGAKGAAIGAVAGATAGIAGVLLTRGEELEIGPETLLTFRLASALNISTAGSSHAFWQVTADDYIVPEREPNYPGNSGPGTVSHPGPRGVPIGVWPETQGLAVGRPGRRECGI